MQQSTRIVKSLPDPLRPPHLRQKSQWMTCRYARFRKEYTESVFFYWINVSIQHSPNNWKGTSRAACGRCLSSDIESFVSGLLLIFEIIISLTLLRGHLMRAYKWKDLLQILKRPDEQYGYRSKVRVLFLSEHLPRSKLRKFFRVINKGHKENDSLPILHL